MSGYRLGAVCACGCGEFTSAPTARFILGHRPVEADKVYVWKRSTVDLETDCINWMGAMFPNGYGQVRRARGDRAHMAHRFAYELFVGPIPDGLVIDHLCRNRRCVNVTHMEPVTQGVNSERGGGRVKANANYRARTRCVGGHEYMPENTKFDRKGKRSCKECGRVASLAHYHRSKGTK